MANNSAIIGRMEFALQKIRPNQGKIQLALTKIGMMIIAKAKIKARQQKIVDRGHLINSLRYEFYRAGNKQGVFVGSFGIKYAAMNEFGGPVTERQRRAMMAAISSRNIRIASKRIVTRSGAGWRWRPRPYLRPAIVESKKYIMDTLREMLRP